MKMLKILFFILTSIISLSTIAEQYRLNPETNSIELVPEATDAITEEANMPGGEQACATTPNPTRPGCFPPCIDACKQIAANCGGDTGGKDLALDNSNSIKNHTQGWLKGKLGIGADPACTAGNKINRASKCNCPGASPI
jgi:hypothetical protein